MIPSIPPGQVLLSVYSAVSAAVYVVVLYTIVKERRSNHHLRSSYYKLVLLQSIADFCMLFWMEIVLKPRKFNYFNLNFGDSFVFAQVSYIGILILQSAMCLGHIAIALNRFTAFNMPHMMDRYWGGRTIFLTGGFIWGISIVSVAPIVIMYRQELAFRKLPSGVVQLLSDVIGTFDGVQMMVLVTIVIVSCGIFYGYAMTKAKEARGAKMIEKRLLICAVCSSLPFIVEFFRSSLVCIAIAKESIPMFAMLTEWWFYEFEILISMQAWSQLIFNRTLRSLVLRQIHIAERGSSSVTISLATVGIQQMSPSNLSQPISIRHIIKRRCPPYSKITSSS